MDKEKWINDALESINGAGKAKPGDFVFSKILHRLKNAGRENLYISKKKAAFGLVTMLVLAVLNAGALLLNNDSISSSKETNTIVKEYFPSHQNALEQYFNK
jgi:hypothetical protein